MKDKNILLREARSDELDSVSLLIRDAYQQYEISLPPETWKFYLEDMMAVRRRLKESQLIVAELSKQLAGAVTLYLDASRSSQERWPNGWACIRLLAVHPAYRGRGIGRALMEECILRCRNQGIVSIGLHTGRMMDVARQLYERMGFVRIAEFDLYPAPGVVAMAYRLDLKLPVQE